MIIREARSPEQINTFHRLFPDKQTLFTTQAWCAIYAPEKIKRFIIEEHDQPVGGFVAYRGGTAWLPTLITPPFAQHCGLFWDDSLPTTYDRNTRIKDIAFALADFLNTSSYAMFKLELPHTFIDMQPFIWADIAVETRYTYRLKPVNWKESGMGDIEQKTRNRITKGIREELRYVPSFHAKYRSLFVESIGRLYPDMDRDIVERLMDYLGHDKRTSGVYDGEELLCALALPVHNGEKFLLLNALNKDAKHGFANAFGLAMAIQEANIEGCAIFDFEGSMIPAVEKNFRRFGGILTPMFSVRGGKFILPALYKKWKG